jgi:hypothetical protein
MVGRLFRPSIVIAATSLLISIGAAGFAQDAATRGSVRPQSRVFNPFDIGQSRLTLNPFGSFEVVETNTSSPNPAPTASELPAASESKGEAIVTRIRHPRRPHPRSKWKPDCRPPFHLPFPF